MLGIGSVVDASTAAYYIGIGADFVVTNTINEMAKVCNRKKLMDTRMWNAYRNFKC